MDSGEDTICFTKCDKWKKDKNSPSLYKGNKIKLLCLWGRSWKGGGGSFWWGDQLLIKRNTEEGLLNIQRRIFAEINTINIDLRRHTHITKIPLKIEDNLAIICILGEVWLPLASAPFCTMDFAMLELFNLELLVHDSCSYSVSFVPQQPVSHQYSGTILVWNAFAIVFFFTSLNSFQNGS